MKLLVKFLQVLYSIYALLLFVVILIIIFPLVITASFFGKIKGGNFIYALCGIWGDVWLPMVGIFHKNIYTIPHSKDKACIFVVNHISYMDIPILVKTLRQHVRVLGKVELSKVPIFGFLYSKVVVMVDRTNNENRAGSVKTLKSVLRQGISIVIFPEGTFNTTGEPLKEFYNGAFRIAIETQTPIKPVVFPDTVHRLHYNSILSLTPGISRAVFMEEIPVEGLGIQDIEYLKKKVYQRMDEELRKWGNYENAGIVPETTKQHS
jgi:1-acyl-sn-glycerol-3-phosphate acyltransferase